jgi:hypothetical protein
MSFFNPAGDSIVVAPPQTLTDKEFQEIRALSFKLASALGIIGATSVRVALAPPPQSARFILEVLSRRGGRVNCITAASIRPLYIYLFIYPCLHHFIITSFIPQRSGV